MSTILLIFCLALRSIDPCTAGPLPVVLLVSQQANTGSLVFLLKEVNSSENPTLRIFLRLKIATYLWKTPCDSLNPENIIREALEDLRVYEKEIPALYIDSFRRDSFINLKKHASKQALILIEKYKLDRRPDFQIASSLLTQKGEMLNALDFAQRNISGSRFLDPSVIFFLHRLDRISPDKVPQLLATIMSAEDSHPGFLSARSFFTLKHLFVREQTPKALQQRYLTALINKAGEMDASSLSVVDIYITLKIVLPEVEKQSPDLYASAVAHLHRLSARLPRGETERLAAEQRVDQSPDPLAQLLVEADAAQSQTLKDGLLTKAAQLSLEKGNVRLAINLALRLRSNGEAAALWSDQFIEGAIGYALDKGNIEVARYGTSQIRAAAIRSSALQKIALYFHTSGDITGAREMLDSAFKLIEILDDDANKVAALLDLSESFMKINRGKVSDLIRTVVKTINRMRSVRRDIDAAAGDGHMDDAEDAMKIAYRIGSAFQMLATVDESQALDLAKSIQLQGLRTAATFGAYMNRSLGGKCIWIVAPKKSL